AVPQRAVVREYVTEEYVTETVSRPAPTKTVKIIRTAPKPTKYTPAKPTKYTKGN
ncbi:MAG: hypothetical protein IE933_09200, partial [Sphingomonadales bacterium]|nr:hypothetical protein [Sphingomonadales bacterium]